MIDIKKWLEKILITTYDTSGVTANEDGGISERLEQVQEAINRGTGTSVPANKSLYDVVGVSYVDGGGAFNTDSIWDDLRTIAQYLIDGTAGNEAGTVLPAGKSLRDVIGTGYVDAVGGFNLENLRDDLRTIAQRLIDGTAGAEAGATLPAGKSIVDVLGTGYADSGAGNPDVQNVQEHLQAYIGKGTGTALAANKSLYDVIVLDRLAGVDVESSYNLPNDTVENTAFTVSPTTRTLIHSIWLDFTTLVQSVTIRVKYQIDGTNAKTFQTVDWTTAMEDGILLEGGYAINDDLTVTIQSVVAQGGIMAIPYEIVYETRE